MEFDIEIEGEKFKVLVDVSRDGEVDMISAFTEGDVYHYMDSRWQMKIDQRVNAELADRRSSSVWDTDDEYRGVA